MTIASIEQQLMDSRAENIEVRAENARLRAEVERLKADNERTHALVRNVSATRDTAVDMHLKDIAEIERLTAALTEYAQADNWLRGARFDPNSHRFDGFSFAVAALEPKP